MKKFLSKKKVEDLEVRDIENILNIKVDNSSTKEKDKKCLKQIVKDNTDLNNILSKQGIIHQVRAEMKHKIESFSEYKILKREKEWQQQLKKKEIEEYQIKYRKRSLDNSQRFKESKLKVVKTPLQVFLSPSQMIKNSQKLKFSQAFFPKNMNHHQIQQQQQQQYQQQQQMQQSEQRDQNGMLRKQSQLKNPLEEAMEQEIFGQINVTLKEYEQIEKTIKMRNQNLLLQSKGEYDDDDYDPNNKDNSNLIPKSKADFQIEQIKKNYFRNNGIRRKSCECPKCGKPTKYQLKCHHLPLFLKHKMKNYFTSRFLQGKMSITKKQKKDDQPYICKQRNSFLTKSNTFGNKTFNKPSPTVNQTPKQNTTFLPNTQQSQSQQQQQNAKTNVKQIAKDFAEISNANANKQTSIEVLDNNDISLSQTNQGQSNNLISFVQTQVDKTEGKSPKKRLVRKNSNQIVVKDAKSNPVYHHLYQNHKRSSLIIKHHISDQKAQKAGIDIKEFRRLRRQYRQNSNDSTPLSSFSSSSGSIMSLKLGGDSNSPRLDRLDNQDSSPLKKNISLITNQKKQIKLNTDILHLIVENSEAVEQTNSYSERSPINHDQVPKSRFLQGIDQQQDRQSQKTITNKKGTTQNLTVSQNSQLQLDSLPKQKYFRISKGVKSVKKIRQKTTTNNQFNSQQNSINNYPNENNQYSDTLKQYFTDTKKKKPVQADQPLESSKKIISAYQLQNQLRIGELKTIENRQQQSNPGSSSGNLRQKVFSQTQSSFKGFNRGKNLTQLKQQNNLFQSENTQQSSQQQQMRQKYISHVANKQNTSLPQIRLPNKTIQIQNPQFLNNTNNVQYIDTDTYFFPDQQDSVLKESEILNSGGSNGSSSTKALNSPNKKRLYNINNYQNLASQAFNSNKKVGSLSQYFPNKKTCTKIIKLQEKKKDKILNTYDTPTNS